MTRLDYTTEINEPLTFSAMITEAICYWEWRRIAYNLLLLIVTIGVLSIRQRSVTGTSIATIFVCGVVANVLYCCAYIVDLAVQYSAFRRTRHVVRIVVMTIGFLFASVLTCLIAYVV